MVRYDDEVTCLPRQGRMTESAASTSDIAGRQFWDSQWRDGSPLPALWNVDSEHFRDTAERSLFREMQAQFARYLGACSGRTLIEVGCARSEVLPLFAIKSGFRVAGMDYSPAGCRLAEAVLAREQVDGEIVCCDVFALPDRFISRFDAVVSFGLVEHFTDTREIVAALARLLRPGGVMFTHIPNMNGSIGWLQRCLNPGVYKVHVPLTPDALRSAHEACGLQVASCDFFLSSNFGVLNLGQPEPSSRNWEMKRRLLTGLTRISKFIWLIERQIGALPTSRLFSPMINCVALRAEADPSGASAP